MHVEGITWHAIVLEADEFAATKKLLVALPASAGKARQRLTGYGVVRTGKAHGFQPFMYVSCCWYSGLGLR
jgi:hypothetical protein